MGGQVVVQYLTESGKKEQEVFDVSNTKVDLSHRKIAEIDISPLGSLTSLQFFSLSGNSIRELDLEALRFTPELQRLNLDFNYLGTIDLTPLSSCSKLQELNLRDCYLTEIDLAPLQNCADLRILRIAGNPLTSIDFSPLSNCTKIEEVYLPQNELQTIDLTPFRQCPNLHTLTLFRNKLTSIDLSPLVWCSNLRSVEVSHNLLDTVDVTALITSRNLERKSHRIELLPHARGLGPRIFLSNEMKMVSYLTRALSIKWPRVLKDTSKISLEKAIEINGLAPVQQTLKGILSKMEPFQKYDIQGVIFEELDLKLLTGFDGDLLPILESVAESSSFDDIKSYVETEVAHQYVVQIERGGPMHFLDLDRASEMPALSQLKDRIHEMSIEELTKVKVQVSNSRIDLRPIWLTAYGFGILRDNNFGLEADEENIRTLSEKIGFELNTTTDEISPPKHMSEGMREYILWRARDRRTIIYGK